MFGLNVGPRVHVCYNVGKKKKEQRSNQRGLSFDLISDRQEGCLDRTTGRGGGGNRRAVRSKRISVTLICIHIDDTETDMLDCSRRGCASHASTWCPKRHATAAAVNLDQDRSILLSITYLAPLEVRRPVHIPLPHVHPVQLQSTPTDQVGP